MGDIETETIGSVPVPIIFVSFKIKTIEYLLDVKSVLTTDCGY